MDSIVIRIDPRVLDNPDLDIRYVLPDLLARRSSGNISDDGYDYADDSDDLMVYLQATDLAAIVRWVEDPP